MRLSGGGGGVTLPQMRRGQLGERNTRRSRRVCRRAKGRTQVRGKAALSDNTRKRRPQGRRSWSPADLAPIGAFRCANYARGAARRCDLVPLAGLEPARISPLDFESSASTNFTTRALLGRLAHGAHKSNRAAQSAAPAAHAKNDAFAQQCCAPLSHLDTIERFRPFRGVTIPP